MTLQVSILYLVVGVVLLLTGVYNIRDTSPWNINTQYIIQALLGLVWTFGAFRFKEITDE